ncbi:permease prefix domain 1-containing protein [Streptomyces avicenniae]|uniref:permease prefix domain 1-containing protein n=1 Tax=Streptomyces avicenniae TaxID=500153 RepID=UPI000699258C|nr:permease prefix domain 1-containing protein [Streptomyces avicenniae]
MTATRPHDPVEDYAAALTSALHGPARTKARMVAEIRDGLADAVAARTRDGMPYGPATDAAVREFGTPDELVPDCQRELTLAQTRHTARTAALTVPLLLLCWLLTRADAGLARDVAVHLVAASASVALLAAAALPVTGPLARTLPVPRRLPLAVAWTGSAAAVTLGAASLALALVSALATDWPVTALACAVTVTSHAVLATSARTCRRCARLALP